MDGVSRALGAEAGGVPPRYPLGSVARYVIREGIALLRGLPLAVLGSVIWYPAWIAPRWVVSRVSSEQESVATYKLATGFLTVPLTILIVGATGFVVGSSTGAVVTASAAPLLGLVALAWRERWGRAREDTTLFLRVLSRPRLRARLAGQRAELTAEFDEVLRRMAE